MADKYEEWASETLAYANDTDTESTWREFFEEVASELLSLARISRG